ncbi:MAG: transcriptional repressor [Verrucomicrobiota bacterium]
MSTPIHDKRLRRALKKGSGDFRMTKQRREVFDTLMEKRSHPTASEVYDLVKQKVANISLATVYNCLETLTNAGLVRQVNFDRSPSRYCPNLTDHAHFHCDVCESVRDIPLRKGAAVTESWVFPRGTSLIEANMTFHGVCPDCRDQA